MPYQVKSTDVWFNLPGVVAAYQPVACPGGPLLARINVSNDQRRSGVYAAVPGVAPAFDPRYGWGLDGATQYLTTGVSTTNQKWSMIAAISGMATSGLSAVCGYRDASSQRFALWSSLFSNAGYENNQDMSASPGLATGVLGVAAQVGYRNGSQDVTGGAPYSTGSSTNTVYIGCVNNNGTPSWFGGGYVRAILIANRTLSPAEMWIAARQMAWCHLNPDWSAWGRRRRYYSAEYVVPPVTADDLKAAAASVGMFGTVLGRAARSGHQQAAALPAAPVSGHRSRLNG